MDIRTNIINLSFSYDVDSWNFRQQSVYSPSRVDFRGKMRKSIWYPRKRRRRTQDANLVETFTMRNENCAAAETSTVRAESSRRDNSSRFTLPFVRLSLTILYAWSNSPLALELREWVRELSESDISLRYALDWRPSSREHLFPFSRRSSFMRLSTFWVLRAGKAHRTRAVGAKS